MSSCEGLVNTASAGVAPALRAVDCLAGQTTAAAFERLFGVNGAMAPALTILLTLYIAFFAFSLITGRSRLGISALTPRMMTLGLVLTFATSWAAYQGVVWTLATGAPDQIAGVLMGARGSATQLFADRIDIVFNAIAQISEAAQAQGAAAAQQAAAAAASGGSFAPADLMWLGAILLLLGTVGVLVTARIALAVLLALGPVFVVLALFAGTRGLFAGWLRGVVLTAIVPLFVVLGGAITLELLTPVIAALGNDPEGISPRAAMALFTIAAVHVALMAMTMKVAITMVSGWQVFGLAGDKAIAAAGRSPEPMVQQANASVGGISTAPQTAARRAPLVAVPVETAQSAGSTPHAPAAAPRTSRTVITQMAGPVPTLPPLPARRARGIGSRFAARPNPAREMKR